MNGFEMFSENSLGRKEPRKKVNLTIQPVEDTNKVAHGFLRRVDMIAGEYNNANYLQENFYDNVVANANVESFST